jgi:excisionase family DNA binding protein
MISIEISSLAQPAKPPYYEHSICMNPDIITLKEAARHLQLPEKTVIRLAQDGELPAQKLAQEWRFRRSILDAWQASRGDAKDEMKQPLPAEATGLPEPITVAGALEPSRIKLRLVGATKDAVLRELVGLMIEPHRRRHSQLLFKALKAREDLCPTCVTAGVAIPHARNALVGLVDKPQLAYGRHPAGVDFGAFDGKPVSHFFLLCAPNVREHLLLLARLSRLLDRAGFLAKLSLTKKPDEVLALVQKTEHAL